MAFAHEQPIGTSAQSFSGYNSIRPRSRSSRSSYKGSRSSSRSSGKLDSRALYRAVRARKLEYTREQTIRIKVGTWNVASIPGTERDIGKWFFRQEGTWEGLSGGETPSVHDQSKEDGSELGEFKPGKSLFTPPGYGPGEIGIYALGLQEVVDISSPAETLKPFVDPDPSKRWKAAVQESLPEGYHLISEVQLMGLLLLIYASPTVAENISSVSSSSVGTGLLGYMGNKGAVSTRLLLGETTCLVFINSHLASGAEKGSLTRRNWDAAQIIERSKFHPIDLDKGLRTDPTESIGKEDFAFWIGDLNYRLEDIPGNDVRDLFARHTVNNQDNKSMKTGKAGGTDGVSSTTASYESDWEPHAFHHSDATSKDHIVASDEDIDPILDPESLLTTISSLLPHDQLRIQQQKGNAFHEGWREGDITFLPTYKYDVGSVARFDSSEKHRGPSWCDRILYRSRRDKLRYERQKREAAEAKERDEEMKARGLDKDESDDSVLFDYDPDVDGVDSGDEYDSRKGMSSSRSSFASLSDTKDAIRLDYYVSHQEICSSDHKPLDAGFTLNFESVIPALKAKVHRDVIREFDKAENESRPGLTVVVDRHEHEFEQQGSQKEPNSVDFGDLAFGVPVTRSLSIANTSGVPATFYFESPKQEDTPYHSAPSWLTLRIEQRVDHEHEQKKKTTSQERTLFPGELAQVEITARVQDIDQVRSLNSGQVELGQILVLRVTSGRDQFISVCGKWLPTCFGRSVDELTRLPEAGARSLADTEVAKAIEEDTDVRLSAPRELLRLTEAIAELAVRAVAEWSMTTGGPEQESPPWLAEPHGAGWPFVPESWTLKRECERAPLLVSAREALDTNQALTAAFTPEVSSLHRLEILCETLQVFLQSLSDGIVTSPVWHTLEQQIFAREKTKSPPWPREEMQAWVLENLAYSPAHSVSFTFVTFMLTRIINEVAPVRTEEEEQRQEAQQRAESSSSSYSPVSVATAAALISGVGFRRSQRSSTMSGSSEGVNSAAAARRTKVEAALAALFSDFLISRNVPLPHKEKERRALEGRKRSIIEPFL